MKCTSVDVKIHPFITYFWLKRILGVIKDTLTYILTGKWFFENNLKCGNFGHFENAENLPTRQTSLRCLRKWNISTAQRSMEDVGDRSVRSPKPVPFSSDQYFTWFFTFSPSVDFRRIKDFTNISRKKTSPRNKSYFCTFPPVSGKNNLDSGTHAAFSYASVKFVCFQVP